MVGTYRARSATGDHSSGTSGRGSGVRRGRRQRTATAPAATAATAAPPTTSATVSFDPEPDPFARPGAVGAEVAAVVVVATGFLAGSAVTPPRWEAIRRARAMIV